MTIDLNSSIPIYYQLKNVLLRKIKEKNWKPGELIPSEKDLQIIYGISRTPVRQALLELEREGYIIRKKGKGTIVAGTKVIQNLPSLSSFTEDMIQKGLKPSNRLIQIYKAKLPEEMSEKFLLYLKEEVPVIERLMIADNEPMAFHVSYLIAENLRDSIKDLELSMKNGASLYNFLAKKGINIHYAKQYIRSINANEDLSKALNIKMGDSLHRMERLVFDIAEKPVEMVLGFYRSDRYQYYVELKRK